MGLLSRSKGFYSKVTVIVGVLNFPLSFIFVFATFMGGGKWQMQQMSWWNRNSGYLLAVLYLAPIPLGLLMKKNGLAGKLGHVLTIAGLIPCSLIAYNFAHQMLWVVPVAVLDIGLLVWLVLLGIKKLFYSET